MGAKMETCFLFIIKTNLKNTNSYIISKNTVISDFLMTYQELNKYIEKDPLLSGNKKKGLFGKR